MPSSLIHDQASSALEVLKQLLGDHLLAVYLHGSAASSGLKPQSDIDMLVVVKQSLKLENRQKLLSSLLELSSPHPASANGPRCLEVIVFTLDELEKPHFPVIADFIYGEWLRDGFVGGEVPVPIADPEMTLILAQAKNEAIPLFGAPASQLLPTIPAADISNAMLKLLPDLTTNLQGDESNVLLTLARMWYSATTGQFISKDMAALWAIPQLPETMAQTLIYARDAYLGEFTDNWISQAISVTRTAFYLQTQIVAQLENIN
ncbi:aminoglycoside adenylyltransferase family protein [Paenochrobactrum sp. BZR 588]